MTQCAGLFDYDDEVSNGFSHFVYAAWHGLSFSISSKRTLCSLDDRLVAIMPEYDCTHQMDAIAMLVVAYYYPSGGELKRVMSLYSMTGFLFQYFYKRMTATWLML